MKERFKRLPEALQKQVIYRLGAGVIFLLCTILILIFFRDIYLLLPALCFAVFFILNGLWRAFIKILNHLRNPMSPIRFYLTKASFCTLKTE